MKVWVLENEIRTYIAKCYSMKKKQKLILFDIDYTLFDTDLFKKSDLSDYQLYEEIEKSLETLSRVSELGIFSEGENDFQRAKLEKTKLLRFFKNNEHIHIMVNKSSELKRVLSSYVNSDVYIIDDKLEILNSIKHHFPSIKVIWLKRGKYAQIQKPIPNLTPDAIINTLSDAVPIVTAA